MENASVNCWICNGSGKRKEGYGHNDYSWEDCDWCYGSGKIEYVRFLVLQELAKTIRKFTTKSVKLRDKNEKVITKIRKKQEKEINKLRKEETAAMVKIHKANPTVDISQYKDYLK